MDVYWVTETSVEENPKEPVHKLLDRRDGFVWVDIPAYDDAAAALLSDVFGFHSLAVRECSERSHVPKVHLYSDHAFLVLHAPELGEAGHVHLLELDQFVGDRFLVTVHGPLGVGVELDKATRETRASLARMRESRFHPSSPYELSYAIVSAVARRLEETVRHLARKLAGLERHVMSDDLSRPEPLVQDLFLYRHELVTIMTMAAQSREVFGRLTSLPRVADNARPLFEDLRNQFDAARTLAEGEERFLQGVVDFYQTRISSELNQFAKRLTSMGAILVAATLVAGIYGMNFRHMPELEWTYGYPMALVMMFVVGVLVWLYLRRKHWL